MPRIGIHQLARLFAVANQCHRNKAVIAHQIIRQALVKIAHDLVWIGRFLLGQLSAQY